ncbi:MAG: hypothetical protein K2N36_06405, partial [Ruminiclostridium sp.]|nr:hypothetical protein [Ruminiclostridium sp.]
MDKVTNEERARLSALANTYRTKLSNDWNQIFNSLDETQKEFLNRKIDGKILTELMDSLKGG